MGVIVAVVNGKGGVGKSTISTNLAARHACSGFNVKLIDTDPVNKSADTWVQTRAESGIEPSIARAHLSGKIYKDLVAEAKLWDAVIVDCPGDDGLETRGAASAADVIVMPVTTGQFDTWSLGTMGKLITQLRAEGKDTPVLAVLNKVPASCTREAAESIAMLSEMKDLFDVHTQVIWDRVAVRSAARVGLGVHELPRSTADDKATAEMASIYAEVFHGYA